MRLFKEFAGHLQDIKMNKHRFGVISQKYNTSILFLYFDCLKCRYIHGADVTDYLAFDFYKLSHKERLRFITVRRRQRIEPKLNTSKTETSLLKNKAAFYKAFSKYINRTWIQSSNKSYDFIYNFLQNNQKCIAKPVSGHKGQGIILINQNDITASSSLINTLLKENYLIESYVSQHKALNLINDSSVNTLRVSTIKDKNGIVHIISAVLRCGTTGSTVDNFSSGGIAYPVDTNLGVIYARGKNKLGEVYINHPTNNTCMLGFKIPNWDLVVNTVKDACELLKYSRYIGWDIAITEDGCEIIEANTGQGGDVMQLDGEGKYRIVLELV